MTFSRAVTLAGWILIGVVITAVWIGARYSRGRFPSGLALLRVANRPVPVRVFAVACWAWVGWHFFVRTSRV